MSKFSAQYRKKYDSDNDEKSDDYSLDDSIHDPDEDSQSTDSGEYLDYFHFRDGPRTVPDRSVAQCRDSELGPKKRCAAITVTSAKLIGNKFGPSRSCPASCHTTSTSAKLFSDECRDAYEHTGYHNVARGAETISKSVIPHLTSGIQEQHTTVTNAKLKSIVADQSASRAVGVIAQSYLSSDNSCESERVSTTTYSSNANCSSPLIHNATVTSMTVNHVGHKTSHDIQLKDFEFYISDSESETEDFLSAEGLTRMISDSICSHLADHTVSPAPSCGNLTASARSSLLPVADGNRAGVSLAPATEATVMDDMAADNSDIKAHIKRSNNIRLGHKLYKRKYDKVQYCPFCTKAVAKLPRHMQSRHMDEPMVEEALKLPPKSIRRKMLLEKLLGLGNYKHNMQVLQSNNGEIITARRPVAERSVEKYLPCEYCFAFCLQRDLWKHIKSCKHKPPDDGLRRRHRSRSALLLCSPSSASAGFKEHVLARMNNDNEAILIRNDPLLVAFGNNLFFQHGHALMHLTGTNM